jgi:hypothetical protein
LLDHCVEERDDFRSWGSEIDSYSSLVKYCRGLGTELSGVTSQIVECSRMEIANEVQVEWLVVMSS